MPENDSSRAADAPVIMVVEDSDAMRHFITAILESRFPDGEVVQAESGFAALKTLPTRAFDLVVTDINMPDINGLELIRYIKQNDHYRRIPVLIISTEASAEDRARGLQLGASAYLTKPFTPDALQKAASALLSAPEAKP